MENKVAILIIVFNISNLIKTQIELIKRFCKDDNFDIIVIDNSYNNKLNISNEIKNHTIEQNCIYNKVNDEVFDFSQSHASACNYAYNKFQQNYEYMFFLDHDNFPTTYFSVKEALKDLTIGGVVQPRLTKTYFWPGCLMINNKKIEKGLVNFSTNSEFGLDTGGELYKIVEKYGAEQCHNFDQYHIENDFDKSEYVMMCNHKSIPSTFAFMHFINGSNWNNKINNDNRIHFLLKVLHDYINNKAYVRN